MANYMSHILQTLHISWQTIHIICSIWRIYSAHCKLYGVNFSFLKLSKNFCHSSQYRKYYLASWEIQLMHRICPITLIAAMQIHSINTQPHQSSTPTCIVCQSRHETLHHGFQLYRNLQVPTCSSQHCKCLCSVQSQRFSLWDSPQPRILSQDGLFTIRYVSAHGNLFKGGVEYIFYTFLSLLK